MPKWLHTLLEHHRMGVGHQPWIKYADAHFDARTMSYYCITLRGIGWETTAHVCRGDLREQIMKAIQTQANEETKCLSE